MLIHMSLKRVVNFHGHLCPDLVIGSKLCEQVQTLLAANGRFAEGLSMVAENRTSALDAIQVLLGLTTGNQRLHVVDYGKHNYSIAARTKQKGYRLMLRCQYFSNEPDYQVLAGKIAAGRASLEDVILFQQLMDGRVADLLELSPETLFRVEETECLQLLPETATVCLTCSRCGQPVLKSHLVFHEGDFCCVPCLNRMSGGSAGYTIH